MAKSVLIAYSTPNEGREQDFNDWYENKHIGQVREAVPAITTVTRYRTVDPTGKSNAIRYVAVYEIDGPAGEAAAQLGAAGQAGRLDPTDTMDVTSNPPQLVWAETL
jgi:hypothetical protein